MPDDTATTATLEEEVKEPPVAADFEAADTPPPEVKPEASIEIEEPPEKSATERLFDSVMELPADERNAALSSLDQRLEEKGEATPWRKRQDEELAATTAAASADAERERRQEELRSWKSNSDAARANVSWIVSDLSDRWEKRGVDDPAPRHDVAELDKQLDAFTNAEAGLRSHAAITEIGNAMNAGLEEYGGAITSEELNRMASAISRGDKVKVYMKALAERVKKTTEADMNKEIDQRIEVALKAQQGAEKVEAMREVKVAPEQVQAAQAAGSKAPTPTEYNDATAKQRAEWRTAGIDPVLAEE